MMIREPAVAGRFYPGERDSCRDALESCIRTAEQAPDEGGPAPAGGHLLGGIVPHAGWICSGPTAARVFRAVAEQKPAVVVIFGAIHVRHGPRPSLFAEGAWETPLGLARVDDRLARRLHGQTGLMEVDPHAHEHEHSIEVEVPFVQHVMPGTPIVPIMVPPTNEAAALGRAIGLACRDLGVDAVFLASTDLTHYGPSYGFTPQGVGGKGLAWARNVNDRRMIELIESLREEDAVAEAGANANACGAGAIAATLAACKTLGASHATLLEHTTSFEVLRRLGPEPMRDAVGYAAMVIH